MLSDEPVIPFYTLESLEDYVLDGDVPGGFLTAVLSNDLDRAFRRADSNNRPAVSSLHSFLFNYAPADCWGSPEKFTQWCEEGGFIGLYGVNGEVRVFRARFQQYKDEHYETA
jgi:hypothetical protein